MKITRIYFTLILLTFFSPNLQAGSKKVLLAILPFENKAGLQEQWLSQGIADTLTTKFQQVEGVRLVDRLQVNILLHKAKSDGTDLNSSLFGANYLLVGSYTVFEEKIRLSVRIVSSESSIINSNMMISTQGLVANILSIQTELARELAKKLKLECPESLLALSDGKNFSSYKLYNRGKQKFEQSQYQDAIDLFIKAQKENEGFYFSEAHSWEGKARIALGQASKDKESQKRIQEEHIEKFRKDAGQASFAYYDLGIALQEAGEYEQAISAYKEYLRWIDDSNRNIIWEVDNVPGELANIRYFVKDAKLVRLTNYRIKQERHFPVVEGKYLILFMKYQIICYDVYTGEEIWKTVRLENLTHAVIKDDTVYVCTDFAVLLVSMSSGKVTESLPLPCRRVYIQELLVSCDGNRVSRLNASRKGGIRIESINRITENKKITSLEADWNVEFMTPFFGRKGDFVFLGKGYVYRIHNSSRQVTHNTHNDYFASDFMNESMEWKSSNPEVLKNFPVLNLLYKNPETPGLKRCINRNINFESISEKYYTQTLKGVIGLFDRQTGQYLSSLGHEDYWHERDGYLYSRPTEHMDDSQLYIKKTIKESGQLVWKYRVPSLDQIVALGPKGPILKANNRLFCINENIDETSSNFHLQAYQRLSQCHIAINQHEEAKVAGEKALAINLDFCPVHYELGLIKSRKDASKSEKAEALRHYNSYLINWDGNADKKQKAHQYLRDNGRVLKRVVSEAKTVHPKAVWEEKKKQLKAWDGKTLWHNHKAHCLSFSKEKPTAVAEKYNMIYTIDLANNSKCYEYERDRDYVRKLTPISRNYWVEPLTYHNSFFTIETVDSLEFLKRVDLIEKHEELIPLAQKTLKNGFYAGSILDDKLMLIFFTYNKSSGEDGKNHFWLIDLRSKTILTRHGLPGRSANNNISFDWAGRYAFHKGYRLETLHRIDSLTGEVSEITNYSDKADVYTFSQKGRVFFRSMCRKCKTHNTIHKEHCPSYKKGTLVSNPKLCILDSNTGELLHLSDLPDKNKNYFIFKDQLVYKHPLIPHSGNLFMHIDSPYGGTWFDLKGEDYPAEWFPDEYEIIKEKMGGIKAK
ncbi:MAG: hypothetical protein HQL32_05820 [Planctomycetes bacterium]|nr:hypothetical protein [Planctomycetota bacterium]